MRAAWLLGLLAGCDVAALEIEDPTKGTPTDPEPGTGFSTGPWEDPTTPPAPTDDPIYEGAYARILSPAPDEVVPLAEPFVFEVGVFAEDGSPLEADEVEWFASGDPDFGSDQLVFETDTLALGTHEITAIVDLPNGDRVAHAVGGVRVQSAVAGTYAGLFSVDGTVAGITITCTGAAVIVLDAAGQAGEGDGDCLVSMLGISVPMTWDFALTYAAGALTGEASVDLVGFFSYDVPMTSGAVDPEGAGLTLEFAATIPFVGDLAAFLEAPRISLDAP
jgi:hypothetical protein